jgi:hypothetical protein
MPEIMTIKPRLHFIFQNDSKFEILENYDISMNITLYHSNFIAYAMISKYNFAMNRKL